MSGIKYDDEHPDLDFGETLGTFLGVEARSNLDDSYFSGESSYIQGVYTGYTYQCVEYSRRVLLVTRGVVFPNCGRASEIFAFEKATHVETGVEHNFVACKNGETTVKPEAGMILIYPYVEGVLPWGHIAVITEVGDDWVGIAEQNQSNKSWLGKPYGRVAKLLHDANTGAWTVQETLPDTHIRSALGWKYIEGVPLRTPISGEGHFVEYAPLKVLPQFLTPRMTPTMTRYRLPNKALEGTSDLHNRFRRDTKSKQYDQVPKDGACWPGPVQEFQSIYFANETMNVPSIPAANNTFQLIGRGLRATVASLSDDEVARRYNIPAFFVPAARLQLQDFNRASLIGTVVTVFSHEKGWRGVESRLDSQAPYAATVLGAQFADENGHGESWKPCTTNHDINRAVTRIAKLKHRVEHRTGEESVKTTLYILEVTAGLDLAVAFTEEEQAAVRLAALDVDVMAGQWEEWREERLKAHASGETGDDERPVFTIRRLGLNDESLRIFNGDILVDGVKADFVVKKEKWSWLFRLLTEKRCALQNQKAFEKFEAFMAAAASTKSTVPVVFQPLWAHMADQPKTLAEASAWGRAEAAKGNTKVANFAQVAPDASDFDEHGRCTLPLYAPDEVKLIKRRFRPQNPAQDPDDQVFASFAGLIVNGYSGFGAILEARRPRSSAPPPTIADAQHIGIRAMYFGGGDLDADMETP